MPPLAGVGSALGFFTAPVAFDLSRSHRVTLDNANFEDIELLFAELEGEGAAILQEADESQNIIFERTVMMRFVGQGAETDLSIEHKPFQQWTKQEIRDHFDAVYQKLYGRTYPETPVEFVTFKVRASLPERPFRIPPLASTSGTVEACIKGERQAFSLIKKEFMLFKVFAQIVYMIIKSLFAIYYSFHDNNSSRSINRMLIGIFDGLKITSIDPLVLPAILILMVSQRRSSKDRGKCCAKVSKWPYWLPEAWCHLRRQQLKFWPATTILMSVSLMHGLLSQWIRLCWTKWPPRICLS